MFRTSLTASLLSLSFAACASSGPNVDEPPIDGKSDSSGFVRQPTMHIGQMVSAPLAQKRHWHEFYAAATPSSPIDLQFSASNDNDNAGSVRLVVFGPLVGGQRELVGHVGTTDAMSDVELDATLTETGKYVVVVAQHRDDETVDGNYALRAQCFGGACDKLDAIVSHRFGGLAGLDGVDPTNNKLTIELNDGIGDTELALLRTPVFGQREELARISTAGGVGTFELPDSLADGEDISIGVAGIDDGVNLRVWREERMGLNLANLTISDFSNQIGVSGVGVFSEGDMWLVLGSEDRGILLAQNVVRADLPGQPGLGLGAFDATFSIPLFDENGEFDPAGEALLPRDGEVLQVATVSEEPSLTSIGCFRFCNNLSDDDGCTDIEEVECTEGSLPLP